MDIQKEREAFEQHLTNTGLVEFAGYGFAVDECDEYLHEPTQVAWESWLIGLNRAKAQAVPEGFILMPKVPTERMVNATRGKHEGAPYLPYSIYEAFVEQAMIEAQEQKITLLKVEWASDCFECGHHEAIIHSTASEASAKGWFHDGDAVKCCKCGHTGEMDARGEDSDICWNENEAQEPTND